MFISSLLMIRYNFPWRVLVSKPAHIYSVRQYSTDIYPLLITSFTNKYLTLMFLVLFKLDFFPFSIRHMLMWLAWNMRLIFTVYPFLWIKYSVHNTGPIISLTLMIFLSYSFIHIFYKNSLFVYSCRYNPKFHITKLRYDSKMYLI